MVNCHTRVTPWPKSLSEASCPILKLLFELNTVRVDCLDLAGMRKHSSMFIPVQALAREATLLVKKLPLLFVAAPFSGCFRKMLSNKHIGNDMIKPWQAILGALFSNSLAGRDLSSFKRS